VTDFQAKDHFRISIYWFTSAVVWGALLGPVLSKQIEILSPQETSKVLGWLYTSGALPSLLVPLLIGPLSDRCRSRFGRRRPYMAGGGLVAILALMGMFFAAQTGSLPLFFVSNFVLQVGSNTALAAYHGVIPDLVPASQRGTASSWMAVMSQIGTLFGAVLGGRIVGSATPQTVYVLLMVVFAAGVLLSCVLIRESPLEADLEPLRWGKIVRSLYVDPRQYPDYGWVWLTRALMMFGFFGIQPFLLFYLRDVVRVPNPETEAGMLVGVILIASAASAVVAGRLSDRIGRKKPVIASSLIIAAGAALFPFATHIAIAFVVGMVFGIAYGMYVSVDWALATDVLPSKSDAAKDMAVWHVALTLPQQVAPLTTGFLLGAHAIPGTDPEQYRQLGFVMIFGLSAVAFLFGGVLVRHVKGVR
jgi:MFS family permease